MIFDEKKASNILSNICCIFQEGWLQQGFLYMIFLRVSGIVILSTMFDCLVSFGGVACNQQIQLVKDTVKQMNKSQG